MRSDVTSERGIALVIVMFMVLAMSMVGASMVFVSRTETLGSLNYKTVTQSRYAAESGVSAATNYLLNAYTAPTAAGADPIGVYDLTQSPVRWNGNPVVLSSTAANSNYPVAAVKDAFAANSKGNLSAGQGTVAYSATATLLSMRQITDVYASALVTLQTWRITGTGSQGGAGSASVDVSVVLEVNEKPAFSYAAFATDSGCGALSFSGGANTDSYDSSVANSWNNPTASGGNVGTNGNLSDVGATTVIDGTLSTPRSGVGNCSSGDVTAATSDARITGGITQLSQTVTYPTPPPPNPLPPTGVNAFQQNSGCPAGATFCTANAGQGATIHPTDASTIVTLGDVQVNGGAILHLSAGIYVVNSLTLNGNSTIVLDGAGPVVFKVAGVGQTTPIDLTGGSISNTTFDSTAMQFVYGGTGNVKLTGGATSSGLVMAPNASVSLSGGGDFFGAIIAGKVTSTGGASIHYDRNLQKKGMTVGNPVLDQFTWSSY